MGFKIPTPGSKLALADTVLATPRGDRYVKGGVQINATPGGRLLPCTALFACVRARCTGVAYPAALHRAPQWAVLWVKQRDKALPSLAGLLPTKHRVTKAWLIKFLVVPRMRVCPAAARLHPLCSGPCTPTSLGPASPVARNSGATLRERRQRVQSYTLHALRGDVAGGCSDVSE